MTKKLYFLSLLCFAPFLTAYAQSGYTHLNLSAGRSTQGSSATAAIEFGKSYHRSYEFFADLGRAAQLGIEPPRPGRDTYLAGMSYKPTLLRTRNTFLKFRGGAGIGTDTNTFLTALQLGVELGYHLPGNYVVILQQKNEAMLGKNFQDPYRFHLLGGIKIPLR